MVNVDESVPMNFVTKYSTPLDIAEMYSALPESSPRASCFAACCRKGRVIPFSPQEAELIEQGGTGLQIMSKEEVGDNKPGRRREFYKLLTDCAFLNPESRRCTISNALERPAACGAFQAGGAVCGPMQKPPELAVS